MDNVFDAQYFGGSVHGVLLVVGGFVHQKGLGVEKNSNQPRYGGIRKANYEDPRSRVSI